MQLIGATDKFQLTTSAAGTVDVVSSYVDADTANPPVVQGDTTNTQVTAITTATTTDIVAAPAASTLRKIKTMTIHNKHASTSCDVSVLLDRSGTDYQIVKATLRAGELLQYTEATGWIPLYAATNPVLRTVKLPSDLTTSSTTTQEATALSITTGTGTFKFIYDCVTTSAATTTGHKFDVNHTGTVTFFVWEWRWLTGASAASSDTPNQNYTTALGGVVTAFSQRDKGTAGAGVTTNVDATTDVHYIIEGICNVSADGDLELWFAGDAAATTILKAGSSLVLIRTGD